MNNLDLEYFFARKRVPKKNKCKTNPSYVITKIKAAVPFSDDNKNSRVEWFAVGGAEILHQGTSSFHVARGLF
ncbi:hypothetical protein JTE90_015552 [Oedothorax gibbosus]|uniref:Uncharacterized protein n=1 Tax=Oedothorax gibbosus TaxID=931172 RepID=A0AAV6TUI1_9ARAC|nr:hypothetical protein JTE90_015552 [Oedothorax gibbosus]